MTCFRDLPESVIVAKIMPFLGPQDLIRNLGSTNRKHRRIAKSDSIWQEFGEWRGASHSSLLRAMKAELEQRRIFFQDEHYFDGEMNEIARMEFWLCQFGKKRTNCSVYKHYVRIHQAVYYPSGNLVGGAGYCCQEKSPEETRALCYRGSVGEDFFCRAPTAVDCQWAGCLRGYCEDHKGRQGWDEDIRGRKWNRCTSCGLELCHKCNAMTKYHHEYLQWIEPTCDICNTSACVDCRRCFLGSRRNHASCDYCTKSFCVNCTDHPWSVLPTGNDKICLWEVQSMEYGDTEYVTNENHCFCSEECAKLEIQGRTSQIGLFRYPRGRAI